MYLSRFGVKHYKCLGDIDIPLTPIHVLIGENDAGKTSLLEAIAAYTASSSMPVDALFPDPWSGADLVLHGTEERNVVFEGVWKAHPNDEPQDVPPSVRYGLTLEFGGEGKQCECKGEWIGPANAVRGLSGEYVKRAPNKTWLGSTQAVSYFQEASRDYVRAIWCALKPAPMYLLDPRIMALPAAIDPGRAFRMDLDGFGLATLLDDILDHHAEQFLRLRDTFCDFFPQFKTVRIASEGALDRRTASSGLFASKAGVGKGIHFEVQSGRTIRAQQASGGAILFLGFLAIAHLPEPPSLLLIEEPENGVYPKRLGEVIKILKQMVKREDGRHFPQIILTTHSPFVLSFFEPEEVTFLSRPRDQPDGPVRARPLRDAPNIRERMGSEFYLGELWYNLSEEDLFGEV